MTFENSGMTFEEGFKQQWESLTNYLLSEMLKSSKRGGTVDLGAIEQKLATEKKRWKLPGQYQYAWLEKLRNEHSEIAREFEDALSAVKMEQVRPDDKPSSALVAGPALGGAVVGFGLTKLLNAAVLMTTVGTIGLGAIGAGVGVSLLKQKEAASAEKEQNVYQNQLAAAGKTLLDIVKRADR